MVYPSDGDLIENQVIAALVARLAAIQAPEYHHSVVDVLLLEDEIDASGQTPMLAVFPVEDQQDDRSNYAIYHDLRLGIGCAVRTDGPAEVWRSEINWLLSDVQRAVLTEPQFGELVTSSRFTGQQIPPRQPGEYIAWGELELVLRYHHLYDNASLQC